MSSDKRTLDLERRTLRGASIAAGVSYLYGILYGVLVGLPISSRLIVSGNAAATSGNIAANEFLYRVNTLAELIMYASVVVLAVSLYIIARSAGRNLSLLALSLRLVEAALSCVVVLAGYAALEFLNGQAHLAAFTAEQRQALVQVLLNIKIAGGRITPLFFCTGSIIFFWLFLKPRYIPRILAGFGIFAYVVFLADDIVNLLKPGSSSAVVMGSPLEIAAAAPVILFEAAVGLWLLLKGVKVQSPAPPSPEQGRSRRATRRATS